MNRSRPWTSPLMVQVRRELWEHPALWMAPLAGAGLLLLGAFFGRFNFLPLPFTPPMPSDAGQAVSGSAMFFGFFIGIIAAFTVAIYLLDCLYAERKDGSILFWKSLPVSDGRTVAAKLLVGLVVVPLCAWLLSVVVHLVSAGIMALLHVNFSMVQGFAFFDVWLTAQVRLLAVVALVMLWYAPVATYLLLASVLARRTPMMLATLPLVLPVMGEQLFFQTHYFAGFLGHRLLPGLQLFRATSPQGLDVRSWLADPALWLGLVAAAGMLYIVVRMRRYRDDT